MIVMTFLDALSATPRDWRLVKTSLPSLPQGAITRTGNFCPYLAVLMAGWMASLKEVLTGPGAVPWQAVFDASDNLPGHNPTIRRALLEACGLPTK